MLCRSCTDSRPRTDNTGICAAEQCTASTRSDGLICLACSTAANRCERCLKEPERTAAGPLKRVRAGQMTASPEAAPPAPTTEVVEAHAGARVSASKRSKVVWIGE